MKKKSSKLIVSIVFTTLLLSCLSFAGQNKQEMKIGTIRATESEYNYPNLAKITMTQAQDIALSNVKGDILKSELEEEDGFLVYGIEIVSSDKQIIEVTIDAGNGEILQMEKDAVG